MSKSRKKEDNEKVKRFKLAIVLTIALYLLLVLMCVLMEETGINTSSQFAPVMRIFCSSMLIWLKLLPLVVIVGVLIVKIISLPKKYDKYFMCISICILIISILFFLL